jgi:hypothetical protein
MKIASMRELESFTPALDSTNPTPRATAFLSPPLWETTDCGRTKARRKSMNPAELVFEK